MSAPQFIRVADVARRLSCSRQHVYDLIKGGHLSTVAVGLGTAGLRVSESELEAFVQSRTHRAPRRQKQRAS